MHLLTGAGADTPPVGDVFFPLNQCLFVFCILLRPPNFQPKFKNDGNEHGFWRVENFLYVWFTLQWHIVTCGKNKRELISFGLCYLELCVSSGFINFHCVYFGNKMCNIVVNFAVIWGSETKFDHWNLNRKLFSLTLFMGFYITVFSVLDVYIKLQDFDWKCWLIEMMIDYWKLLSISWFDLQSYFVFRVYGSPWDIFIIVMFCFYWLVFREY